MTHAPVSLVVPVYNVEALLPRCLDSILGQTRDDWEAILVDDGSPDRSGDICDAYAARDARFRVVHQPNAGVSEARNRGVQEAAGEYVQFVDSDDWLDADCIAMLLTLMDDAETDLVVSAIRNVTVGADGTTASEVWALPRAGRFDAAEILGLMCGLPGKSMNVLTMPSNKLYRRRLVVDNDIAFPAGMHPGEDSFFNLACLGKCRKVAVTDRAGYNYLSDLSDDRITAVQRYTSSELDDWTLFCRLFRETARERAPDLPAKRVNAACASLLVAAVVRFCRRDATLPKRELLDRLRRLVCDPDVAACFRDYRPGKGQSAAIPFFIKTRLPRPLLLTARRRADARYGAYYGKTLRKDHGGKG
jgi:glycosyltransferase involved in cell wall biosynthesis